MADKFISEEIQVVRDENSGQPQSFIWREESFVISEVIAEWQDYGFSAGAPKKRDWRMRRHRTCYRVETTQGAVFEMYHDRGLTMDGGKWILSVQIS